MSKFIYGPRDTTAEDEVIGKPVIAVALGVSACVVAVAVAPLLLHPNFGPIDDHTYASWLSRDGRLAPPEAWSAFLGSEVGMFGRVGRWRPAYWAIQLLETVAWQDIVWPRYLFRALLLIAIASCQAALAVGMTSRVSRVLRRDGQTYAVGVVVGFRWDLVAAGLAAFWFAGMYAWSDIVTRLGPSELFAASGFTILLVGFYRVLVCQGGGWLFVFLGFTLAAFSKENFVILVVPIVAVGMGVFLRRRSLSWSAYLCISACFMVFALMVGAVGTTYASSGDVYGSRPSLSDILLGLAGSPERAGLYGLSLIAWVGCIWGLRLVTRAPLRGSFAKWGFLAGFSAVVIMLFETLVYGVSVSQPRYLLLTELCLTWLFASACFFSFVVGRQLRQCGRATLSTAFQCVSLVVALAMSLVTTVFVAATTARSYDNADRAGALAAELDFLSKTSGASPTFILVASSPGEYETVVSLSRYISWRIPTSRTTLLYLGEGDTSADDALLGIQKRGLSDGTLSPLASLSSSPARCLILDSATLDASAICDSGSEQVIACEAIGLRSITNWLRPADSRICILPSGREVPLGEAGT